MRPRSVVACLLFLASLGPGQACGWPGVPSSPAPLSPGLRSGPEDLPWPDIPHARRVAAPPAPAWTPVGRDYLIGRHQPGRDPRFARVPPRHVAGDRRVFLRREVLDAFESMAEAARADGVRLRIVSGTRTFEQQQAIWSAIWRGERPVDGQRITPHWPSHEKARWILQWIAMPATSRHHWGTEVDINSTSPGYFERSPGREEYAWLARHAARFGFCQTYGPRDEDSAPGYREEKWHWSYLPLSRPLLAEYVAQVGHGDIRGFAGDDTVHAIDVRTHYILGIDPRCR